MAKKDRRQIYTVDTDSVIAIPNARNFDPQKIGEALEELRAKNGGQLKAEAALEAARSIDHPLHQHIEWDDRVAADKYRLDQVRGIIAIIRTEVGPHGVHRAFINLRADDGHRSYRAINDILDNKRMRELMLAQAEADLDNWMQRYRELKEIVELVRPAREALAATRRRKNMDEGQHP